VTNDPPEISTIDKFALPLAFFIFFDEKHK
jgi:hypothetical protein